MKARLLSGNLCSLHLNDTARPQGPRVGAYIRVGGQVTADPGSVPAALRAAPVTPLSELQPPCQLGLNRRFCLLRAAVRLNSSTETVCTVTLEGAQPTRWHCSCCLCFLRAGDSVSGRTHTALMGTQFLKHQSSGFSPGPKGRLCQAITLPQESTRKGRSCIRKVTQKCHTPLALCLALYGRAATRPLLSKRQASSRCRQGPPAPVTTPQRPQA